MKQLFYYIIIRLTTRHAINAVKIYETIYHKAPTSLKKKDETVKFQGPGIEVKEKDEAVDVLTHSNNVRSKRQEIKDSLNYLRSKQIKTKQDKSSISMLEGVLASM